MHVIYAIWTRRSIGPRNILKRGTGRRFRRYDRMEWFLMLFDSPSPEMPAKEQSWPGILGGLLLKRSRARIGLRRYSASCLMIRMLLFAWWPNVPVNL